MPSPSTGAARTSKTMGGNKSKRRAASATPWDGVPQEELTPAQAIVAAGHRSIYAFRHERFDGDALFFNGYPRSACPFCGAGVAKAGFNRSGVQRYRCKACARVSTPVTGTIFDNSKLPVAAWSDFILQALSFESVSAMTRENRRADTTSPYWMAKLFEVLEGIQDDAVLSGRVWIDETYWPVAAADAVRRPDGRLPRGLSRNQLCIGVGVDGGGRKVFLDEGRGRTNHARTWEAFGGRIAPGSTLVHDLANEHRVLTDRIDLVDERHNANLLKGVPDELNPLNEVNRQCFMVKSFLRAHSGFNRDQLQGYLNLLYVAMNEPSNKLEKVAIVLDRAMRCPKTLRFREFYNVRPSSEFGD